MSGQDRICTQKSMYGKRTTTLAMVRPHETLRFYLLPSRRGLHRPAMSAVGDPGAEKCFSVYTPQCLR